MAGPCYDRATRTDCPRRAAWCQLTCPEWAAYIAQRDKAYEARRKKSDAESGMCDHYARVIQLVARKKKQRRG